MAREWAHHSITSGTEHDTPGNGVATLLALCWRMSEANARRAGGSRAAAARAGRAPSNSVRPGTAGPESLAVAALDSLPALLAATAAAHDRELRSTARLRRRVRDLESEMLHAEASDRARGAGLAEQARVRSAWSLANGVAFHSVAPDARRAPNALQQRVQGLEEEVEVLRLELSRSLALLRRSAARVQPPTLPQASPPRPARDQHAPSPTHRRSPSSWALAKAVLGHHPPSAAPSVRSELGLVTHRGVTIGPAGRAGWLASRGTGAPDPEPACHVGRRSAASPRAVGSLTTIQRSRNRNRCERAPGRQPADDDRCRAAPVASERLARLRHRESRAVSGQPSAGRSCPTGAPQRTGLGRDAEGGGGLAGQWLALARAEADSHPAAGRRVDELVRRATQASQRLLSRRASDAAPAAPPRRKGSPREAFPSGGSVVYEELEPRGTRVSPPGVAAPPRTRFEAALERAATAALTSSRPHPMGAPGRQGRGTGASHPRGDAEALDGEGSGSEGEGSEEEDQGYALRGSADRIRSRSRRHSDGRRRGSASVLGHPSQHEELSSGSEDDHDSDEGDSDESEDDSGDGCEEDSAAHDEASGSDDSDLEDGATWTDLAGRGVAGAFQRRPREPAASAV